MLFSAFSMSLVMVEDFLRIGEQAARASRDCGEADHRRPQAIHSPRFPGVAIPIHPGETPLDAPLHQELVVGPAGRDPAGAGSADAPLTEKQVEHGAGEGDDSDDEEPGKGHPGIGTTHDHPDRDSDHEDHVEDRKEGGRVDREFHGDGMVAKLAGGWTAAATSFTVTIASPGTDAMAILFREGMRGAEGNGSEPGS